MPPSNKILVLSRYYDHLNQAAAIRVHRLVASLTDLGYHIVVITQGPEPAYLHPDGPISIIRVTDQGRLPTIFQSAIPALPKLHTAITEPELSLWCHGVAHVCEAMLQQQVDAILASAPPFSLLPIACRLKQHYHVPTVLDFRDAWYTGMFWPFSSATLRHRAQTLEQQSMEQADGIIAATDTMRNLWTTSFPAYSAKSVTVRHGYEPAPPNAVPSSPSRNSILRIGYIGQTRGIEMTHPLIKKGQQLFRYLRHHLYGASFCENLHLNWMSPQYLMQAMAQINASSNQAAGKIQLEFVGAKIPAIDHWAKSLKLQNQIIQHGTMPYPQAQQLSQQMHLLTVNLYGIKNCDYHWCVPSKLYQYLGLQKPILGLLPPGEAYDILHNSGLAHLCHPTDVAAITAILTAYYHQHQHGGICVEPNHDYIQTFSVPTQRAHFQTFWRRIIAKEPK